jgi:non-lysosomal glucosylceramidase
MIKTNLCQRNRYLIILILVFAFPVNIVAQQDLPSKKNSVVENYEWPVLKSYSGENLSEVAMPLGGIGTGTVSIGGRGDLRDWELGNRGALGWTPGVKLVEPTIANAPFFALYYKEKGKEKGQLRLLEGPISESKYYGDWGCDIYNAGFPRFEEAEFKAAYPLAQLSFKHKDVPLDVKLKAFNPMIPGDEENSSIPVAILTYSVKNNSDKEMEFAVCGMIPNYIGIDGWGGKTNQNENEFKDEPTLKGLNMFSNGVDSTDVNWGTMALSTSSKGKVTYRTSWAKLGWNWTFREFIDDFTKDGELVNLGFDASTKDFTTGDMQGKEMINKDKFSIPTPPATLSVKETIAPGEEKEVTFYITWNFPNRRAWDHGNGAGEIVGNYYSTQYIDAWDVAQKVNNNIATLEKKTVDFVTAFCESDIPVSIKEAALFNSCNVRSQTVFQTADGYPFGWEGTGSVTGTKLGAAKSSGWGYGTCSHVWNYESTIPFLFGDLSMKFREVEFLYATHDNGGMSHRVGLPLKDKAKEHKGWAADGQMGTLIKVYRDWQLSGNDDKLKEMWPNIKKAMSFAWTGVWDTNKDGVMEGSQHNTMDINYHGPNPQMSAWYLGALKASIEMADYMNDKAFKKECEGLFKKGSTWVDANLFNGEYYEQIIPEGHDRIAQLGKGCLVDQLVGQYLAHTAGLGYVLDESHVKTTLQSVMKYNWVDGFNDHTNTFRSFGVGDEAGLIMASYPKGELLDFPFPYYTEIMTGFEYSTAIHMIYEGQLENGIKVFEAIRDRFDGKKRNPFNEGEYGHRYARAMAAWGGVVAWTGFEYSAIEKTMKFNPINGNFFWSNGYAYGTVNINDTLINIEVLGGQIALDEFTLKNGKRVQFKEELVLNNGDNFEFEVK